MRDWAIDYIMHVLEQKDWSMNRLATEAGVASTTISRPLKDSTYSGHLARSTIAKIREASGIDPTPFIPKELLEDTEHFAHLPRENRARSQAASEAVVPSHSEKLNQVVFTFDGQTVKLEGTFDRRGLVELHKKIEKIESLFID